MKKVLIITYYWPPAGGPGVQRVLKFAKYLPRFGWEPIILTVKNGDYPALDESLVSQVDKDLIVYKSKIWEPHKMFKRLAGRKNSSIETYVLSSKKNTQFSKFARFIRLNLFIPDARIGWFFSGRREANKIIRAHKPDLIFTSSPPHSLQLIGKYLSDKWDIPWVADFRDPWLEIVYYQTVRRSRFTVQIDKYLEKKVLSNADKVVTISDHIISLFRSKVKRTDFVKIPNGFDEDDFLNLQSATPDLFTITYTGTLSEERIPFALISALEDLLSNKTLPSCRLLFVGNVCPQFKELLIENSHVAKIIEIKSYLPHKEAIQLLKNSSVLLLVIDDVPHNKGFLSGKVFDYLGARKPIFAFGPTDGDAAKLISSTNSGLILDYNDIAKTKDNILALYNDHNTNQSSYSFEGSMNYSRRALAEKLAKQFSAISNTAKEVSV